MINIMISVNDELENQAFDHRGFYLKNYTIIKAI